MSETTDLISYYIAYFLQCYWKIIKLFLSSRVVVPISAGRIFCLTTGVVVVFINDIILYRHWSLNSMALNINSVYRRYDLIKIHYCLIPLYQSLVAELYLMILVNVIIINSDISLVKRTHVSSIYFISNVLCNKINISNCVFSCAQMRYMKYSWTPLLCSGQMYLLKYLVRML